MQTIPMGIHCDSYWKIPDIQNPHSLRGPEFFQHEYIFYIYNTFCQNLRKSADSMKIYSLIFFQSLKSSITHSALPYNPGYSIFSYHLGSIWLLSHTRCRTCRCNNPFFANPVNNRPTVIEDTIFKELLIFLRFFLNKIFMSNIPRSNYNTIEMNSISCP